MDRSALVDLSLAASVEADVLEYLMPRSALIPERFAPKPFSVDDFLDHAIDPTKWSVTGSVTEASFLGVDGLEVQGPAVPVWDAAGIIYKPAITAQVGRAVVARAMAEHPVEFMFSLQEYAFTVDSVVTPTTWTLKHTVAPQDLRNSMGIIWRAGSLYFFEGGAAGNEEYLGEAPWRGSKSGEIYGLQVVFIFTATGWDIWAYLPGVWSKGKLIKQYVRPGGVHAASGYSLCINKFTADDSLLLYHTAFQFRNAVLLQGARVVCANTTDRVIPSSLVVQDEIGIQAGLAGLLRVRFTDLGATLYTLAQLAQVTQYLTGKQVYPVEFELSGDVVLGHPVRITIQDATLTESSVTPE